MNEGLIARGHAISILAARRAILHERQQRTPEPPRLVRFPRGDGSKRTLEKDEMSDQAVDKVAGVVGQIEGLAAEADALAKHLQGNIDATREAFAMTKAASDKLGGAAARLRGALGMTSNFRPGDDAPAGG